MEKAFERFQEQSEHPLFDNVVFWIAIILALIGNFVFGIVFIPFLLVMRTWEASGFVFLLGVSFGYLFLKILKGLSGSDSAKGSRVIAWIFLPVVALVTVYVVTTLTNKLAVLMDLPLSRTTRRRTVYAFSLILPYLTDEYEWHYFLTHKEKRFKTLSSHFLLTG